jgi:hypothetical protein
MIDTTWQDIRYALRLLRRNLVFSLTAMFSLALGIGASTTIFAVANALLLRTPPAVADPGRLVDVGVQHGGSGFNASYPDYLDIRARTTTLDDLYATQLFGSRMTLRVAADGSTRPPVFATAVSGNYFTALGVSRAAGRLLRQADETPPADSPVIVLSHRLWTRAFDRNPAIVGQTLRMNGRSFTVVGVAPERFSGTRPVISDARITLTAAVKSAPEARAILVNRGAGWLLPQRVAAALSASLGLVGVLLAAIGLYGSTAYVVSRRTREIGIHIALGAQPRRIVLSMLGGGVRLSVLGTSLGALFAVAAARAVAAFLFGVQPWDARIFGGASVLVVAIGMLACYLPARRAAAVDPGVVVAGGITRLPWE